MNRQWWWSVLLVFSASGKGLLVEGLEEHGQELANRHRQSRRGDFLLAVDLVAVASAHARLGEIAALFEVADDLDGGPLRDPNVLRNVSQTCVGLDREVGEHLSVAGDQAPTSLCNSGT